MKLNNVSITVKIAGGFGIVLVMLMIIAGFSYVNLTKIGQLGHELDENYKSEVFVLAKEIDHLKWMDKLNELFLSEHVNSVQVQTDDHKCGFGKFLYGEEGKKMAAADQKIAAMLEAIKEPHRRLHQSAINIDKTYIGFDPALKTLLAERWIDHLTWVKNLSYSLLTGAKFSGGLDPHKCAFGKWYDSYNAKDPELQRLLKAWEAPHKRLHESAAKIVQALSVKKMESARAIYQEQTLTALDTLAGEYKNIMQWVGKNVEGQQAASRIYEQETKPALANTQGLLKNIRDYITEKTEHKTLEMKSTINQIILLVGIISVLAVLIGTVMAFIISRSISKSLIMATDCLRESADEFAATSKQIEGSSQLLAEGATEQAASLEETSASIEEIASMTRQNADNASQAENLAEEGNLVVGKVEKQMGDMAVAISEIKKTSEETGNIIKTIDEIAFQTNLLALNASVEAARAGEAGAGFSVVADEVRNLAMRAADAAKNTGALIDRIIKTVHDGHQMTISTQDAFKENVEIVRKIASVVKEIAVASEEQARGISQINSAASEMDKVTQQTAYNAQECATAADRLLSQNDQLRECVEQIGNLVYGDGQEGGRPQEVDSKLKYLTN